MTETTVWCVITTIQSPTACVRSLAESLEREGMGLVVAGDRKGPSRFDIPGAVFLGIEDQIGMSGRLPGLLPENHYTRKNLGYIEAIRRGALHLYETDDDNHPMDNWRRPGPDEPVVSCPDGGWVNVYGHFSAEHIWPRGLPLDAVKRSPSSVEPSPLVSAAPIRQGLADGSPDVDAIWRLLHGHEVRFGGAASILLKPGTWSPFNSQNTWWLPEAYPLLYLPSLCSFRMTDIWRSFVAQRCLWSMGAGVVFHGADVWQERNEHDLLRDFSDEVPGYTGNAAIARTLEELDLAGGTGSAGANLLRCYEALVQSGVFPERELALVEAWLADVEDALVGLPA